MRILFNQFLQDKRYLDNLSETTLRSYNLAFKWFEPYGFGKLDEFVVALRKAGMSPGGCNVKIRSINSFLSWCHRKGHIPNLKIKLLKSKVTVPYQLNDAHVRALINYKPKNKTERRLHSIVLLNIDTGIRIAESLGLAWNDVDFDNLLLTVTGKGNKQRVIPFSIELRKVLYKLRQSSKHHLVFCNRHGGKLNYHNVRRDLKQVTEKLGIECGFHDLRRYFITNAIKMGVNPVIVQRLAGHSSFAVTSRYIYLVTDDLTKAVKNTSALTRYR